MTTLSEILRWLVYTVSHMYYRVGARLMRRDRLLSRSERRFRALLEGAPDAMIIVDHHGHIALMNARAEEMFGYARSELVGQSVGELIPEGARGRHRNHQKRYLKHATVRGMGRIGVDLHGRRKDGTQFPVEISLSPLETEDGTLVVSAIRDVTERKHAEAQLRYLADHDVLTGLLNRRCFESQFAREVAAATRHREPGALLLIDIDGLKDVNDTLGHRCGDDVLRRIATLLHERLRTTDVVARLGGDEFAIVLPRTPPEDATELSRELLASIRSNSLVVGDRRVAVSCSAGLAAFGESDTHDEVMLAADVALYAAKEQGRDRLVVHTPGTGEVVRRQVRASWTQRLREILDAEELVPYRQPILDTTLGEVTQYELLVRVLNEAGQPISPVNFLPTAERTGMVVSIDLFMVDCALRLLAGASANGNGNGNGNGPRPGIGYAVNLSARSLAEEGLAGRIAGRIERSGVDPRLLVFEITETAAIANMDAARRFAEPLRDLGCTFALDDFGAGFASLSHLKHLSLDWLKIDGEYIRGLAMSPTDQVIVRNVAAIARSLGLRTTAEFVEDAETLDMVTGYGVGHAQGFHIGRPEPVDGRLLERAPDDEEARRGHA